MHGRPDAETASRCFTVSMLLISTMALALLSGGCHAVHEQMRTDVAVPVAAPPSIWGIEAHREDNAWSARAESVLQQEDADSWAMIAGDPTIDAKVAIGKEDRRFIAVYGYTVIVPGVSDRNCPEHDHYRVVPGTSDAGGGELDDAARSYAMAYNTVVLQALPPAVSAACKEWPRSPRRESR